MHIIKQGCKIKRYTNFVFLFLSIFLISILQAEELQKKSKVISKIDKTKEVKEILLREKIITIALSYLGTEYWPGGQDTDYGMDCSGFTQLVYKKVGINIPRTSYEQYLKAGKISRGFLKKGDLVFFSTRWMGINHVGIYLGDNKFIHAPSIGKCIKIDLLNSRYWGPRFISGGRYIF
ncbi:MAG: C40 family peptidase [Candidatus Goldbacteria bacterium]|nr:C40 family peptidase [Candidatus Goldiibacteriota bacterium]